MGASAVDSVPLMLNVGDPRYTYIWRNAFVGDANETVNAFENCPKYVSSDGPGRLAGFQLPGVFADPPEEFHQLKRLASAGTARSVSRRKVARDVTRAGEAFRRGISGLGSVGGPKTPSPGRTTPGRHGRQPLNVRGRSRERAAVEPAPTMLGFPAAPVR